MKKHLILVGSLGAAGLLLVTVCGGLAALFVASLIGLFSAVGKPADAFLTRLGTGDTTGAYNSGASGLRAAETPESFAAFVKSSRLDQYQSSHWNNYRIVNRQATVEGTVILKDGSIVPLRVSLVNEGGWKVTGLERIGGSKSATSPTLPASTGTCLGKGEEEDFHPRDMGPRRVTHW